MTTTITNVTEQCSPLQCFEELVQGQSVANTQGGADTYTECQCGNLFSPALLVPSLFLTSFVEDEVGKNVPADERFTYEFRDIRDRYRGAYVMRNHRGRTETIKRYEEAARELKEKVITPMLAALRDAPQSAALMNDLSIAIAKYADIAAQAEAYEYSAEAWWAASQYLLESAKVRYNELVRDAGAGELDGVKVFYADRLSQQGEPIDILDVERYNGLLYEMRKATTNAAMERRDGTDYLDAERSRFQEALDELTRLGFEKKASEMKEYALFGIGVERNVLAWLHANDPGWFSRAREEKRVRFFNIRGAVNKALEDAYFVGRYLVISDAGEFVSPAGIAFLEIRRLTDEIDKLKGDKVLKQLDDGLARRYLELAVIYHNVGEHDKAVAFADEAIKEWRGLAIARAGTSAGDYADMNARNAAQILQRFQESHRQRLAWDIGSVKALHAIGIRKANPPEGEGRAGRKGRERPVK